jgi:hypothetical protein
MISFLSDSESRLFVDNYDLLWNLPAMEQDAIGLMERHNQIALKFYDWIRLHAKDKIRFSDLNDIGVSDDQVFKLILVILIKQGSKSIEIINNPDGFILVYYLQAQL